MTTNSSLGASGPIAIAIDGPAAAGKGTLARRLAAAYGLAFLDTGALYRGVAWLILEAGRDPADSIFAATIANGFDLAAIDGAEIRTRAVGAAASVVAVNPDVRAALLSFQRRFASHPPAGARGAVLDGRDIGTIVCPDAPLKLFVTASPEARARRRWLELVIRNPALTEGQVLADIKERDARDRSRESAPLEQAPDAHLIDTTHLSIDAAFAAAQALVDPLFAG
ncbi:MAG: (d)CMP kinase [Pseudomonadota bacterium]